MSGDLLSDPASCLVNPVNCVGVAGKGLALVFRQRWLAICELYRQACQRGEATVGAVLVVRVDQHRWVARLPTERHWREPSQLFDAEARLQALAA